MHAAGLQVRVEGSYQLRVKVVSWSGTGYDAANTCCDGLSWTWWTAICDTSCDNYFLFCLRPYGYDTTSDACPSGSYQTGTLGSNSITFSSPIQSGVPNPLVFTGGTWTVRAACNTEQQDTGAKSDYK